MQTIIDLSKSLQEAGIQGTPKFYNGFLFVVIPNPDEESFRKITEFPVHFNGYDIRWILGDSSLLIP